MKRKEFSRATQWGGNRGISSRVNTSTPAFVFMFVLPMSSSRVKTSSSGNTYHPNECRIVFSTHFFSNNKWARLENNENWVSTSQTAVSIRITGCLFVGTSLTTFLLQEVWSGGPEICIFNKPYPQLPTPSGLQHRWSSEHRDECGKKFMHTRWVLLSGSLSTTCSSRNIPWGAPPVSHQKAI